MPPPSYRDYRLPPGRHGLGAEEVAANQRWRLIGAASEVLAEKRLLGLSSRLICRRAGVSNHTFYKHFHDVDDLITVAFANAAEILVDTVADGCMAGADHDRRTERALAAALTLGAEERALASLMRLEIAVAIPAVGAERERLVARLAALVPGRDKPVLRRKTEVASAFGVAITQPESRTPREASALPAELARLLD